MGQPLWRPSLDRIDSSKGYRKGNIQLVARIVNEMKGALPIEEYKEMCVAVARARPESQSTLV
jgi:hypothetical protein